MDKFFDGFEYCRAWFKKMNISFAGVSAAVDVQINGYDDEKLPVKGKTALISFLDDIDKFPTVVSESVLQ